MIPLSISVYTSEILDIIQVLIAYYKQVLTLQGGIFFATSEYAL